MAYGIFPPPPIVYEKNCRGLKGLNMTIACEMVMLMPAFRMDCRSRQSRDMIRYGLAAIEHFSHTTPESRDLAEAQLFSSVQKSVYPSSQTRTPFLAPHALTFWVSVIATL